jgi:Domain of unknown function (DUF6456)
MSKQPLPPGHPWALGTAPTGRTSSRPKVEPNSKRLLRRLAAGSGSLEPVEDRGGTTGRFRFFGAGLTPSPTQPVVDSRTVRDWRARGWIEPVASGLLKLTATGHAAAGVERAAGEDGVSPFRRQHGLVGEELCTVDGTARRVTADAAESPLGWLARRRDRHGRPLIDEAQYAAGEKLRADFTIAGLSQRVTASWEQTIESGSSGRSGGASEAVALSERAMDARRRVNLALVAAGPELAGILLEVCCLTCGLEAAERRLGLPQRAGKVVLQIALSRLADHYGLASRPAPVSGPVRVRSWGAEAYRPTLFGSDSE